MDHLGDLLAWVQREAPATHAAIRPPADEATRWAAERRTGGLPWPADVIDLYTRCDGLERTPSGYLLPGYRPLALDEVVQWWEVMLHAEEGGPQPPDGETARDHFFAQLAANPSVELHQLNAARAGTRTGRFIGPWLPVAEDQSGSFLVVDRRRGPRRYCVLEMDEVDVDAGGRSWRRLDALFEDVLGRLVSGDVPVIGGRLVWDE